MKRKTCKILLSIGFIIIVLFIIGISLFFILASKNIIGIGSRNLNLTIIMTLIFGIMGVLIPVAIILMIIAWINWNSKKREQERQEVRQAQLEFLKRGNVNIDMKGKMRKLK